MKTMWILFAVSLFVSQFGVAAVALPENGTYDCTLEPGMAICIGSGIRLTQVKDSKGNVTGLALSDGGYDSHFVCNAPDKCQGEREAILLRDKKSYYYTCTECEKNQLFTKQ